MTAAPVWPTDPRLRIAVARRMLYRAGCDTGIAQHVSERAEDEDAFWVSALDHGDVSSPGSVAKFGFDQQRREPGAATDPPLEFAPDYSEIYTGRPEVNAVVHTHSFWAMVLCTRAQPVGMYNITATLLHGDQAVFDGDLTPDSGRGRRVAEALGDKSVLFMRNHGIVVAAPSLERAVVLAGVVEEQARLHLAAEECGGAEMADADIEPMRQAHEKTYFTQTWAANMRRLRMTDPDLFSA